MRLGMLIPRHSENVRELYRCSQDPWLNKNKHTNNVNFHEFSNMMDPNIAPKNLKHRISNGQSSSWFKTYIIMYIYINIHN